MWIDLSLSRAATPRAPSAAPTRCDGYAGAYSATNRGPMQDMSPPQRVAFRHPRGGVFRARCKAAAVPQAWTLGSDAVSHGRPCASRRSPARRHYCRSARNGRSGPPGSRAISLSFQAPAVCTWTSDGPIHVPSLQTTAYCSLGARWADTNRRGRAPSFLRSDLTSAERRALPRQSAIHIEWKMV